MKLAYIDAKNPKFPPVNKICKTHEGILCAGGNLEITTLLDAYSKGIFPWYNKGDPILWWSPDSRMVLMPENIHISSSMKKWLKKTTFTIKTDTDFSATINACANYRDEGTWIHDDMITAYTKLHHAGFAHSIEIWNEEELCGGLYGVALGKAFFGESMFSRTTNASKMALIYLAQCGLYNIIDCQNHTYHLESMGAKLITREDYLKLLNNFSNLN